MNIHNYVCTCIYVVLDIYTCKIVLGFFIGQLDPSIFYSSPYSYFTFLLPDIV